MSVERIRTTLAALASEDYGEPLLVELIRAEIERDGPITFARFMERALYEPGLGYYATSADRTTRAGDFLTAPELHPVFGWTLAGQISEMWERLGHPSPFTLREFGAGTGALGRQIAEGLTARGSGLADALTYEPVEVGDRDPGAAGAGAFTGCVLANEFLDALPFHRVRKDGGMVSELLVAWSDGRFVEVPGEPTNPALADAAAGLPEGHVAEVSLATAGWLRHVASTLERGYVLVIDYAMREPDLFSPSRATGTARAFRAQHVSSDVLGGTGQRDITCHVNLDHLEREARGAEFDVLGTTTAARFLLGSGLDEAYAAARVEADREWESAALLRSSVRRLLDTGGLGGYAVVVLATGVEPGPPLRGLAGR